MRKFVHKFAISLIGVEVYASDTSPDDSDSFCTDTWRITLGMDGEFHQVMDAFLHELAEIWATVHGCRWHDTKYHIEDSNSDALLIVMRHSQFDSMFKQITYRMLEMLPMLSQEHDSYIKSKAATKEDK